MNHYKNEMEIVHESFHRIAAKFSYGGNFCTFCMMPRCTKIKSTKIIFAFEILIVIKI